MNDITTNIVPLSEIVAMERVERDAWLDMFAAAPTTQDIPRHAVRTTSFAVIADKSIGGSEFNRCLGLGVDASFTEPDLEQAIGWLDANAAPNWAIQLPPIGSADVIARWMQPRGLEPSGTGWARFVRRAPLIGNGVGSTELTVREVFQAEGADFGAAIMGGFGFPETLGAWFAALAGRPGWRLYVAYAGDVPAACGALYLDVDAGWGWLGCDATLPAYRLRGAQTALIQRRIADATAAGVEALTAETGQPAAGQEPGRSYQNYLRAGFTKAYVRPNFRRVKQA